jgi:hypothetical protein
VAVSKTPNENAFLFGSHFLHDHVGLIIDEPPVAVLELIANCYDAGANRVEGRGDRDKKQHAVSRRQSRTSFPRSPV